MDYRNPIAKIETLFAGHNTGHWSLPSDLLAQRAAIDRIQTFTPPATDLAGQRAALVADFLAAAQHDTKWPTAGSLTKTVVAATEARELADASRAALEQLVAELSRHVVDQVDVIIIEHLRPAHDLAVTDGRAAAATFTEAGADPAEALRIADTLLAPELRPARTALDSARIRYAAVRDTRAALVKFSGEPPEVDIDGVFTWCKNLPEIWDGHARRTPPPWPTGDPVGSFCWLMTSAADLWCPVASQQDSRYREVFGAGMERVAHARRVAQGGLAPVG